MNNCMQCVPTEHPPAKLGRGSPRHGLRSKLPKMMTISSISTFVLKLADATTAVDPSRPVGKLNKIDANSLSRFDQLPESAHVRLPVVTALFGVSPATVWRWSGAGHLPAPVRIGGVTLWNVGMLRSRLQQAAPLPPTSPASETKSAEARQAAPRVDLP